MVGDRVTTVEIFTPARLHLGFLDLHGGLGRRYGSLGLTIEGIGIGLRLERAATASASGPSAARALRSLAAAASALGVSADVRVTVEHAIPEHAGLGSGTQMGLAVAAALARLHGLDTAPAALADAAGRGLRSGIGIGAFAQGGFLVDGGRSAGEKPAPIIARLPFPAGWRILLILDPKRSGLHDEAESAAFGALPDFSEPLAGHLCRLVLLRLLPGLAESDFAAVSAAIGEVQERIGNYFAAAQNGRFSSPSVARVLEWLSARGILGIGQSSWGPTGFAIIASEEQARALARELGERSAAWPEVEFRIVQGRNRGAVVTAFRDTGGVSHG